MNINYKPHYVFLSVLLLFCYVTLFIYLYKHHIYLDHLVFKTGLQFDNQYAHHAFTVETLKQEILLENQDLKQEISRKSALFKDLQANCISELAYDYTQLGLIGGTSLGLAYFLKYFI
jgi:hypothetical protein